MTSGFIVALGIIQLILFATHAAVYGTLAYLFALNSAQSHLLAYIFLGLSMSFLLFSVLSGKYFHPVFRFFYFISAVWLGFFYYLFIATILFWIVQFACAIPMGSDAFNSIVIKDVGIGLFAAGASIAIYGMFHAVNTKVKHLKISLPNLPESWRGKKLVFISDTHFGSIRNLSFARKIIAKVNAVGAEALLIGGDLFDGTTTNFLEIAQEMTKAQTKRGIFFITGNHEEFDDNSRFLAPLREVGIKILNNESVDLDGLQIAGVDYRDSRVEAEYKLLLENMHLDRNKPSILMKHVPTLIDVASQHGVSMQLSGHSHLGQNYPNSLVTHKLYKEYQHGLHPAGKMHVYTSSGVGTWGTPMRVGTDSEIIVIELV